MPVYSKAHNTKKQVKQCTVCLEFFPESTTYFYRLFKNGKPTSTLKNVCKDCTPSRGRKPNKLEDVLNKYEVNESGCWIYKGALDKQGYGTFYYRQSGYKAHKIAYQLLVGPTPEGLVLDHLCKNKSCINPKHLEPVTQKENARRWFDGLHCSGCNCEVS